MSLIAIPALISNIGGDFYEGRNRSAFDFTMLGNQKGFEEGTTKQENLVDYEASDSSRYLVIYSDIVNTVFFSCFLMFFK
jgi:hypothetical protein